MSGHRRSEITLAAVAALVLPLMGSGTANAAPAARSVVSNAGAPVVVTGTVTNGGAPVPGALVRLTAWPKVSVLAAAHAGVAVSLLQAGSAVTGADGAYALTLDPASVPPEYVDDVGDINLTLRAETASYEMQWTFGVVQDNTSVTTAGVASALRAAGSRSSAPLHGKWIGVGEARDALPHLDLELGAHPSVRDANASGAWVKRATGRAKVTSTQRAADRALVKRMTRGVLAAPASATVCTSVPGAFHNNLSEFFAHAYGWSGAKPEVTETVSSTHSLGIGLQVGSGAWQVSGDESVQTHTDAGGDLTYPSSTAVFNRVNYRDYSTSCGGLVQHTKVAVSFYDLLNESDQENITPPRWSCDTYHTSGLWHKSTGKNTRFAGVIDIGPINVDAQAGWTTNTELSWTITSKSWMCGSTTSGWASSPEAETYKDSG